MARPKEKPETEKASAYVDERLQYPTIDEDFRQQQYGQTANDNRQKRKIENIQVERAPSPAIPANNNQVNAKQMVTAVVGGKREVKVKIRAVSASYTIFVVCGPIYLVQLVFWLLALAGIGLGLGAFSVGDFFSSSIISAAVSAASYFFGDMLGGMFIICWLISSALGVAQLFIAAAMYALRGVNPWKGEALVLFGLVFACYFLPLGLIPWGILWMWKVVVEAGK